MSVIIFILILGILVLVHELGHFLAAKKNGVLVEEFGIGLPPRIIGKKIGETIYSLNLIPLGGFVKLYGEEYHEMDKNKPPRLRMGRAFISKKPWQKAVIIISGVIGNFLLAWVLISFLFTQGVPAPTNKVIVEKIQSGSPAQTAGLKEKDIILKLIPQSPSTPQIPLTSTTDLINLSQKYAGREIALLIDRNGHHITTKITPRKNPPNGQGPLGIIITSFVEKKYPWYQAPFFGLLESFKITQTIVKELGKTLIQLITLRKPQVEVTGPIGIARYTGMAIKFGQNAVLELVALLSLNLAVINIFPFPALDGGRLTFVIYEWITKKGQSRYRKISQSGRLCYINNIGHFNLNK